MEGGDSFFFFFLVFGVTGSSFSALCILIMNFLLYFITSPRLHLYH
jgi:hypothetical protein